jgi:hypothetical protein
MASGEVFAPDPHARNLLVSLLDSEEQERAV